MGKGVECDVIEREIRGTSLVIYICIPIPMIVHQVGIPRVL